MENLRKLAELAGISSSYVDKTGVVRYTTDRSRELFLKSMGYQVGTKEDIKAEMKKFENVPVLPDVLSFFDDEKIEFEIKKDGDFELILSDEEDHVVQTRFVQGYTKIRLSNIKTGYYSIQIRQENFVFNSLLIYAPKEAYQAPFIKNFEHIYGGAVMLYALRSEHSMGIGDFSDLEEIVKCVAQKGGDVVGINPLGVMSAYTQNEERLQKDSSVLSDVSPYRTLSRSFINYVYLDLRKIEEFSSSNVQAYINDASTKEKIRFLNQSPHVKYAQVLELKLKILELMFEEFEKNAIQKRLEEFEKYQKDQGEELENLALFESLLEEVTPCDYWKNFPNHYDKISSLETQNFKKTHQKRLRFFKYCHWLADHQLQQVQNLARKLNMKVGLYADMPIGAASNGVEVYQNKDAFVLDADIGAPADPMRPRGQSWGFTPYHPVVLKKQHYQPFISLVRANMRHCGALRIDHAMGLRRLFWGYFTPDEPSVQGAYIYYEMKDMVAILNLESHRAKCMVICEDLGTVPEGFREYMKEHALLSYKVTARQKEKDGSFIEPEKYDYLSLAQFSTHDQATSCGFWKNEDIEVFKKCGLYATHAQYEENLEGRKKDRYNLIKILKSQNLTTQKEEDQMLGSAEKGDDVPAHIEVLFNQLTAQTNSAIYLVRLNDIYRQVLMDNAPGTVKEYPNWRIKMNIRSDEIGTSKDFNEMMDIIKKARP